MNFIHMDSKIKNLINLSFFYENSYEKQILLYDDIWLIKHLNHIYNLDSMDIYEYERRIKNEI